MTRSAVELNSLRCVRMRLPGASSVHLDGWSTRSLAPESEDPNWDVALSVVAACWAEVGCNLEWDRFMSIERRSILVFIVVVFTAAACQRSVLAQETGLSRNRTRAIRSSSLTQAESLAQAFQSASDAILPSVVKVRTVTNGGQRVMLRGLFPVDVPDQEGLGSGVIIDPEGIVMTNNHVVKDADEIRVILQDGRELYATEYTTDPLTDLAIVRVKTQEPLPAARFGDSDVLNVGDWVLAVGHPLDLETSVSAGIISAKGRSLDKVPRARFLQTDAAINPGNSGGPLVNLRGEVVGINTAIASQTGGYQGIGFAVPSDLARDVISQLRDQGTVSRGYLGVALQDLTNDLAQKLLDPPTQRGVIVTQVMKGTPAERAGVRPGDVITQFSQYGVDSRSALQRAVERVPVGTTHRLNFVRFGKPMTTSITTLRRDFDGRYRGVTKKLSIPVRNNNQLGFEIADVEELARRQGFRVDKNAVIITNVERDSLADEQDLTAGLLITQVGDRKVNNVDELRNELRGASLAEGILLLVKDPEDDSERFVVVRAYQ